MHSENSLNLRMLSLGGGRADSPRSILYIMSREQRIEANYALQAAQQHALVLKLPLIVLFVGQGSRVGVRAQEHINFMTAGIIEVQRRLAGYNIPMLLRIGRPLEEWLVVKHAVNPATIYMDLSPLAGPRQVQQQFAATVGVPIKVVDSHNIVPIWLASPKQEIGARTLRPKIKQHLATFLVAPPSLTKHPYRLTRLPESLAPTTFIRTLAALYPTNNTDITRFMPGETAAQAITQTFIAQRLCDYAMHRNNPAMNYLSELSPYLHFGHISSLTIALLVLDAVQQSPQLQPDADVLLEELIIRKELSDNFCYYNPHYNDLTGAPLWAQQSLSKHLSDKREFIYSAQQFEAGGTHDRAWNAAQQQLRVSGKMHGYMRMYWAKKVLEWSQTPTEALTTLTYLNDFYSLDGGDPNGYVGILWSVAGLHDRPWGERNVYGMVRSMVYGGLKRKFDIAAYERQWLPSN
ncbi:MAG: deoxyribodipyrimidine photo-lyase [Candidatus Saccharimonadales bacterium]